MKKHYFFFDIDGTLTDNATHRMVPSAVKALQLLRENGHFVAIATGRARYKTIAAAKEAGVDNYVCYGGGSLVINNVPVDDTPLDREKCLSVLEHFEQEQIGWLLLLEDSDQVVMKDYRFLEQAGRRKELTSYCYEPDMDYHSIPVFKKIYGALTEEREQQCPWINELGHLRMTKDYVVFQYDAKKDGILRMMKYLNSDPADVVVFGDDTNDLVMFDPRWTSIAMGNGREELKKKADYVTANNTDDGILKACLHFGWISENQLK